MTNAEMAAWFAAQPPDEKASITQLDAGAGRSRELFPIRADDATLAAIPPDELGLAVEFDDEDDSEEAEAARKEARKAWIGEVVLVVED